MRFLNDIRKPKKDLKIKYVITYALIFLVIGIIIGIISKYLDSKTFTNPILNKLDIGNFLSDYAIYLLIALSISVLTKSPFRAGLYVLLFFIGMTFSYHIYTKEVMGFNPSSYMRIWYGLTFISPIFSFISWYAKGNGYIPIIISSIIMYVMLSMCFSVGSIYFDFRGILYTLSFIGTILVLYKDVKSTTISFIIGLLLAFVLRSPLEYFHL